jgi:hypothetical protein
MAMNTYEELTAETNRICEIAINNVTKLMLQDLKAVIMRDTYNSHSPNVVYDPSYEFLNAWEWTPVQKAMKSVSTELFYNWREMKTDPATYKHVDYISGADNRERLASILNIQGLEPGNPIAVFRYSFWNEYILDMGMGGKAMSYFDREFGKFNIKR